MSEATAIVEQPAAADELAQVGASGVVSRVFQRIKREGRWADVEPTKDAMIREARKRGLPKLEAQAWAYAELDRLYPPIAASAASIAPHTQQEPQAQGQSDLAAQDQAQPQGAGHSPQAGVEGQTAAGSDGRTREGLGQIPAAWPELPANASLPAEIAWVQAERLRVVEEPPGKPAIVRLERARSPAPSWSALAWLETSIRSYAKYVEVAAKAAGAGDDEQDQVRRERMAIEEIRSLLAEMLEAQ